MAVAGEVIIMRVFDLGATLHMDKARAALGPMAAAVSVHSPRAVPEYVSYAAPIPLDLSSLKLDVSADVGVPVLISARLYEVGALAIALRLQTRCEKLSDLAKFQASTFKLDGATVRRSELFNRIVEAVRVKVKPAIDEVFDVPVEAESYTAFCLVEVPGGAEKLFRDERAQMAGLLINDAQPERLSSGEIEDTLRNSHSYYRDDLVIADWDAAIIVDPSGQYEDILYVCEVANLQLLALRKYDAYLDSTLEKGYDDFERLAKGPPIYVGRAREMVRELSEVRMDLAQVTDEVANTAKFFGDWYTARVYMGLAAKLHIADYHKNVEEKLETLNDLYQSVATEIASRQNLLLESMIVLLIVFEVIMALVRH